MRKASFNVAPADHYNNLAEVFSADEFVRDEGRLGKFLEYVAPLFHKHSMSHFFGVGLLHKHNDLNQDQIMFQTEGVFQGDKALICRPITSIQKNVGAPILYDLANDNRAVGLEFSNDSLVFRSAEMLVDDIGFLESFSHARRHFGVEDYLGISALSREFFLESIDPELIQVEESDIDEIGNVIRLRNKNGIDTNDMIQTVWAFSEVTGAQCVPLCSRGCFPRSPGHSTEHYPNHGLIA